MVLQTDAEAGQACSGPQPAIEVGKGHEQNLGCGSRTGWENASSSSGRTGSPSDWRGWCEAPDAADLAMTTGHRRQSRCRTQ